MRHIHIASRALIIALGVSACGVSQRQEIQLGQEEAAQVQQQLPMVTDPVVQNYVSALGTQIASRTSRADLPWEFHVVNSDVVNAFALPGGIIYVNRGVIERADRMDELAAVMSHEIDHVVRRHSVKQIEQVQGANVGLALTCVLTRVCGNAVTSTAINVGGAAYFAKFSRTQEREADEGGFQLMINAGINPTGMLTFFEKLAAEGERGNSNVLAWFDTHPGTQDRVADVQRMLAQVPRTELQALTSDTPAFHSMKERLSTLPRATTTANGR